MDPLIFLQVFGPYLNSNMYIQWNAEIRMSEMQKYRRRLVQILDVIWRLQTELNKIRTLSYAVALRFNAIQMSDFLTYVWKPDVYKPGASWMPKIRTSPDFRRSQYI